MIRSIAPGGFGLVMLALTAAAAVAGTPAEVVIQRIDMANYEHYMEDLLYTHLGDNRGFGPQHDLARGNIVAELQSFGLPVVLEPFTYNSNTYFNVVATQTGTTTPDSVYVVGAHFDSVNNPGADDNATGTAAVMELARVLSQHPTASTIHYVLFDREEQGLHGSYAFVAAHAGENIVQAVIMDMVGHDSGAYGVDIYGKPASSAVVNGMDAAIAAWGTGLGGFPNLGNFAFSDHWPFEVGGIPACVMVEDCYQCNTNYHMPGDALDVYPGYIDYLMIEDLLHAVGAYLATQAGLIVESCAILADCADTDSNGVRDDGCVWWACDGGTCTGVDIVFADLGGEFGSCGPDGIADAHDRFHALNCFSNQNTTGAPGYPCESAPPAALNVDAGGPFGDCSPDGVCDGHDAFHAINAFDGSSTCTCAGPAPEFRRVGRAAREEPSAIRAPATAALAAQPDAAPAARLELVSSSDLVSPGGVVEVEARIETPLSDLRGYQLHLVVRGGQRGRLELVDISIQKPNVFSAAAGRPAAGDGRPDSTQTPGWSAFNIQTHQMLAGLDSPGLTIEPGYLATFVLRASGDAAGTFAVELLADGRDPTQRTFLFPTGPGAKIEISRARPAMIHVPEARAEHSKRCGAEVPARN